MCSFFRPAAFANISASCVNGVKNSVAEDEQSSRHLGLTYGAEPIVWLLGTVQKGLFCLFLPSIEIYSPHSGTHTHTHTTSVFSFCTSVTALSKLTSCGGEKALAIVSYTGISNKTCLFSSKLASYVRILVQMSSPYRQLKPKKNHSETSYLLNKLNILSEMPVYMTPLIRIFGVSTK